jgi:hypothetical protein
MQPPYGRAVLPATLISVAAIMPYAMRSGKVEPLPQKVRFSAKRNALIMRT